MSDDAVEIKPKRGRGRPRKDGTPTARNYVEGVANADGTSVRVGGDDDWSMESITKGVTASWLAKAMRMDLQVVKLRLANVTPMANKARKYVYDIKTAMPHLVDPVGDIEDYIRRMDPKTLPVQLTDAFWTAEKKRLQTMEMAKDLWRTTTVIEGYATIFKVLRDDTKLWADTLDETSPMTEKQRQAVQQMIDGLLDNIYVSLKEFSEEHATRAEVEYIEERLTAIKEDTYDRTHEAIIDDLI